MADVCSELQINVFELVCMLGEMPSVMILKLTSSHLQDATNSLWYSTLLLKKYIAVLWSSVLKKKKANSMC